MRDKPFGAALLDVARQTLLQDIAPGLEGGRRYTVLMVANAMGIVGREIEQQSLVERAWREALSRVAEDGADLDVSATRLVRAIRDGEHDADAALHGALRATANVAAGIWKPSLAEARHTAEAAPRGPSRSDPA
jgi:Domain of unknown function (DUF6285)